MIKHYFSILLSPYPANNVLKRDIVESVIAAIFIFLSNTLLNERDNELLILLLFCGLIGLINFLYFQSFRWILKTFYIKKKWLLLHEISLAFGLILLLAFINYQIIIYFEIEHLNLEKIISRVIFIGFILITIFTLSNYFIQLNINLKQANAVNAALHQQINSINTSTVETIELLSANSKEKILLHTTSLLFIQASGNYVEIHTTTSKKLLRISMKKLEEQLSPLSYVIRCHRSYMINLHQVKSSKGNSHSLTLQLINSDKIVPVSRHYYKQLTASKYFDPNLKIQD